MPDVLGVESCGMRADGLMDRVRLRTTTLAPRPPSCEAGRRRGAPPRPTKPLLRFRGSLDLAALLLAVGLARLDPALALAAVLARTAVAGAGAGPLALARVDAGALHHVGSGLVGRAGDRRAAQDEGGRRRGDHHSLAVLLHPRLLLAMVRGSGPQLRRGAAAGLRTDPRRPGARIRPGPKFPDESSAVAWMLRGAPRFGRSYPKTDALAS